MLSIIIPIYNVADTLEACLESLENAAMPSVPVELVFVNDDSPQAEQENKIISSFINKSNRFSTNRVDHKYNKGLAASRNTGLKSSRGSWIIWLDSDDTVTPNGIMDRWLWRNEHQFHYGSYNVVNCNTNKILETRILQPFNYADHFSKNIMPVWTGILHRSKVLQFNELYRVAEDYDMTLKMALEMPFIAHPEIVVNYTWARSASLSFDSFWHNHMPPCVHESKRKCLLRVMAQDYAPYADKHNDISAFRKQFVK